MNYISRYVNALSDEDQKKRKAALVALYKIFVLSNVYIEKSIGNINHRGTNAYSIKYTETSLYAFNRQSSKEPRTSYLNNQTVSIRDKG